MLKKLKEHWLWIGALVFVLAAWFFTLLAFDMPGNGTKFVVSNKPLSIQDYWQWRGTFGDMFGAANSLFSALTVLGIAYGIVQQQKELKDARASAQEQSFNNAFVLLVSNLEKKRSEFVYAQRRGLSAVEALAWDVRGGKGDIAKSYLASFLTAAQLTSLRPEPERSLWSEVLFSSLVHDEVSLLRLWVFIHPSDAHAQICLQLYPFLAIEDAQYDTIDPGIVIV